MISSHLRNLRQAKEDIREAILSKGGDVSSEDGFSSFAEGIISIPTGGGGLDLTTSLTITADKTTVYDKDKVIITATLMANYDDLTPSDVDLKGYLKNATIRFVNLEFGRTIGSATTDEKGVATFEITERCMVQAYFDGTNDYNSCNSDYIIINSKELPNIYGKLDYIQGTGTQYIELDYILQAHDIVEGTVDIQRSSSQYGFIFGARRISANYNCYGLFSKFGGYDRFNYARTKHEANGANHELDTKYSFRTKDNTCTIHKDGVIVDTITSSGTIEDCINNCGVFCANTSSGSGFSPDSINYMKLYDFKILSENNEYIRYLVPCYRKSDNVAGLYDLITDTFYTNNGSGEFITPIRIIYEDKCDNDSKLNNYNVYTLLDATHKASLTYNENENAYVIKPFSFSRTDEYVGFIISDMENVTNYKCEISFKSLKTSTRYSPYNQLLMGVVDLDTGNYYGCRARTDNKFQEFLIDYGNEYEQTVYSPDSKFTDQYYKMVIEKDGTGIICKLFDENNTQLGSFEQVTFVSDNVNFFIGVMSCMNSMSDIYGYYIKDIVFTELE